MGPRGAVMRPDCDVDLGVASAQMNPADAMRCDAASCCRPTSRRSCGRMTLRCARSFHGTQTAPLLARMCEGAGTIAHGGAGAGPAEANGMSR